MNQTKLISPCIKQDAAYSRRVRAIAVVNAVMLAPWARSLFVILFFPAYFSGLLLIGIFLYAAKGMPSVETFWTPNRPVSVQILDRSGRDILVRGAKEADPVRLAYLPSHVTQAVMAIEDRRFYQHSGIDLIGLFRALKTNHEAGRVVQGGSTLTQQLAKNVFLTSDKTLNRKLQEMLLAVWLERSFSKDEIFEKYLNRIYFGGNAWGLEAAARQYFHKPTHELNLQESALLAAILKGPSRYNPVSSPARASKRTALVLAKMEEQGDIDNALRHQALLSPIRVFPPENADSANYFIDWIWGQMEAIIGPPRTDIVIRTTLDQSAQDFAYDAVQTHLDPKRGASQAALITLDGSGGVQAMIGGTDYGQNQFNRAVQASRQPGSAFKPFVYLSAFDAGLTPWDHRTDTPIDIDGWKPGNFTNKFLGDMTLEAAFALSVNTIAVQISEEIGRERIVETAREFGLPTMRPLRSIALGAQNVTPLDLTSAYLPFANSGDYVEPYGILSISTADGTPLYQRAKVERRRVVSSQTLGHMNRIMKRTVDAGTGRRAKIANRDVAGKTGTTNDYRDAWFVGYVPDMVTGVWVGADNNVAMQKVTGGTIPAKIWHSMMNPYLEALDSETGQPRFTAQLPISQAPLRADANAALDLLLDDIELVLP